MYFLFTYAPYEAIGGFEDLSYMSRSLNIIKAYPIPDHLTGDIWYAKRLSVTPIKIASWDSKEKKWVDTK